MTTTKNYIKVFGVWLLVPKVLKVRILLPIMVLLLLLFIPILHQDVLGKRVWFSIVQCIECDIAEQRGELLYFMARIFS